MRTGNAGSNPAPANPFERRYGGAYLFAEEAWAVCELRSSLTNEGPFGAAFLAEPARSEADRMRDALTAIAACSENEWERSTARYALNPDGPRPWPYPRIGVSYQAQFEALVQERGEEAEATL